jgi:hypothetical protein
MTAFDERDQGTSHSLTSRLGTEFLPIVKSVSWTLTANVFSQFRTSPISQSFHAASLFERKLTQIQAAAFSGDHRTHKLGDQRRHRNDS